MHKAGGRKNIFFPDLKKKIQGSESESFQPSSE